MKPSRYNIWIQSLGDGAGILLNSLCASLTTFEPAEINVAKRLLANPAAVTPGDGKIRDALIAQRCLVDDAADELAIILARKKEGRDDRNRLDIVIMPTLDCNFACTYCYEERRQSHMTDEVELAIRAWLSTEIPKHKVAFLSWFGGEPTLALRRVVSITQHVIDVATAAGVRPLVHMTTNGYLLNGETARQLTQSGILNFQITLDGPRRTHDSLRVLRDGSGTFDRVFRNIVALVRADENVRVSLRMNFNHLNLDAIPELLEAFPRDVRQRLRPVFEPIFGDCSVSATANISAPDISEALSNYHVQAGEMGYDMVFGRSGVRTGKLVYCVAERRHHYILDHQANVFKCSVGSFKRGDRVGFISGEGKILLDDRGWNRWVSDDPFDEVCRECAYLPLCMGGCRKARLEQHTTGSFCSLIPTNTSYLLKQIALGGLPGVVQAYPENIGREPQEAVNLDKGRR